MPRLFFGNFDFEESLARPPGGSRPETLQRLLAELASCWVAVVEAGDIIWCPRTVDKSFVDSLLPHGWPSFRFVHAPADIPAGCELVPWGWTAEAVAWGTSVGAQFDAPPLESVRAVNSRHFSYWLERATGTVLPGTAEVADIGELRDAVNVFTCRGEEWLVKAEFTQAGRGQYPVAGRQTADLDDLTRWALPRLQQGQRLYVEPRLDAIAEAGIQLHIARDGAVTMLGVVEMIAAGVRTYSGSLVSPTVTDANLWTEAADLARQVGHAAAEAGYFGPLGVDAMRFRAADGEIRLRAIQDVNARWTMGRLSLGLARFTHGQQAARWLHGPARPNRDDAAGRPGQSLLTIPTSPASVSGQPVQHATYLAIWG